MTVTINGSTGWSYSDNIKHKYGTGEDLEVSHNGTDSHIDNNTGDLYLTTTGSGDDIHIRAVDDVQIKVQGTENAIIASGNGSVDLYYNGSKKFETLDSGIRSQGGICFGSDTAAVNHLADYEEGTFTPAFRVESQSSNISTSTEDGKYTKIGNMCTVWIYIVIDENPSGTGTSKAWEFLNLPFTSASDSYHHSIGSCRPNQVNSGDYGEDIVLIPRLWNSTTQGRVEAYEQGAYAIRNASTYLQSGTGAMVTLTYPCQ